MNYANFNKKYIINLFFRSLFTGVMFISLMAGAQNVNRPNTSGPMGLEINSYTGNLFFERMDFSISSEMIDIDFNFSYNSFNMDSSRGFGNGWGFEYDMYYQIDTAGKYIVVWGDGREESYTPVDGGSFQAPVGFFNQFKEYEPGKFSLTEPNGLKYLFEDNSHRGMTKMIDLNGNYIKVERTNSLITSIADNFGRTFSLAYNSKGMLSTVTDAITSPTRTWSYGYDEQGNLSSVTDPLGAKERYTYFLNGPVQTVSDKNMNVVDVVYYSNFSVKELVGCNRRLSFSYDTAQMMTVVTEYMESGENQINKFYYSKTGDMVWLSAISSNCCGLDTQIEYDANGNKIKETDANGNQTLFSYDDIGNLLTKTNALGETTSYTYLPGTDWVNKITYPKGYVTSLEYDSKGNLTKLTDPENKVFTATYDANGQLTSSTNPEGKTFTYTYDANGNVNGMNGPEGYNLTFSASPRGDLLSYTDPNNHSGTYQYDILGRLTQLTDHLSNELKFSYDAFGNMISFKNKNSEQTKFKYDASNRIKEIAAPLGDVTKIGYDGMDNIVSITDPKGAVSSFLYDSRNLLKSIIDAEGNDIHLSYDRNGNLITADLPTGATVTYTYDALDRVIAASDETGFLGSLEYDALGNISKFTDANGASTTYEYDKLGRMKKVTNPIGKSIEITYNNNGQIKTIKDKKGKTASFTYDDLGRVTSFTDNIGGATQVGYDAAGNITSLTDANGNVTSYTYDALDRVTKETFPDGKFTQYTYDLKNNITSFKKADGSIINFSYDSLNRLITKTLPDGQMFSYTYDSVGQVKTATNSRGTVSFTYDLMRRVTSEEFDGRKVNYNYNIAGRTQTTVYPDSTVVVSSFDTRNRLVTMQKNGDPMVTYQYNNNDQVVAKLYANGVVTSYEYDFSGRLTSIKTGSIQDMVFSYDDNGNITSVIRGTSNESEFFTYDDNNRLINYKRGKDGGPFTVNDSYTYDALGNRTAATIGGKSISYTKNNLNQMLSMNDGTTTTNFTYDDRGNLTFDGKYQKTYDAENRLISESASPTEVISYQYDALGRRTSKIVNGNAHKFTYSDFSLIEERDAADNIINKTFFSGYLSPVVNERNDIPYYYHQNHLLSVDALTDVGGDLVEKYLYDVYGKQMRYDADNNVLTGSVTGNRFGFTGQVYDSATGHNQFFFRNYNPETGLFDQQDLIGYGDGMGMYQYVGNNPANGIDILGLNDCGDKEVTTVKKGSSVDIEKVSKGLDHTIQFINALESVSTGNVKTTLEGFRTSLEITKIGLDVGKIGISIDQLSSDFSKKTTTQKVEAVTDFGVGTIGTGAGTIGAVSKLPMGIGTALVAPAVAEVAAVVGTGVTVYATVDNVSQQMMNNMFDPGAAVESAEKLEGKLYNINKRFRNKASETNERDTRYVETFKRKFGEDKENWSEMARDIAERLEEQNKVLKKWQKRHVTRLKNPCPQNGNPGGTQKNNPNPGNDGLTGEVFMITSTDPNEIIGPEGQPDLRWVSVNDRLPYTVNFENDITASAPAKYIKVEVPVHEKMDVGSFQLAHVGFNDLTFTVPAGTSSTYQRLDAREALGIYVDMTAGFDVTKNQFFWEFQAIDPVTMMAPDDPMVGFLLLQDTTKEGSRDGHGFVNFSVKPVSNAQTLDSILAYADIVFDLNDTIPTNIEKNVIDAVAPTSHLNTLGESYDDEIPLSWSGSDDPNGSGIAYYSLYYSKDGTNFSLWKDKITRTDTTFTGPGEQKYFFFVLATDSTGNTEQVQPGVVLNTYLGNNRPMPLTWLYFNGSNKGNDNILEWATTNEQNSKEFIVERSLDGVVFEAIGTVKATGNEGANSSYKFTDYDIGRLDQEIMYYRLVQMDNDGRYSYSGVIRINYDGSKKTKVIVYPNPTKGMVTVSTNDQSLIGTIAQVYDEAGKLLQSVKITSTTQQFNLNGYMNGIYFIRLAHIFVKEQKDLTKLRWQSDASLDTVNRCWLLGKAILVFFSGV